MRARQGGGNTFVTVPKSGNVFLCEIEKLFDKRAFWKIIFIIWLTKTKYSCTALAKLYAQDGINFDPSIVAGDEITQFVNGTFQMAFCWNISQEVNNADALTFDVLPMAFPSDSTPSLQGGIWGFGVFNNGDEAKIEAAKTFIKFMTEDDAQYFKAVAASTFAPCRDLANSADLNPLLPEYTLVAPMMGDYYQITTNWTQARTEWWNMLQRVMNTDGSVEAILAEMEAAQTASNAG